MTRDDAKARGVVVKPLVWGGPSKSPRARTVVGVYALVQGDVGWALFLAQGDHVIGISGELYRGQDILKAAAQADYETRILGALE